MRDNLEQSTRDQIIASLSASSARMREEIARLERRMTHYYSHNEIEAACGGEVAQMVRAAVLTHREEILHQQETPCPHSNLCT